MEHSMPTEKIDLSLRLKHPHADMISVIEQIGMKPHIHWNKGDPRQTPTGTVLEGQRDFSYCSFPLVKKATTELDELILECLESLTLVEEVIHRFVKSGGTATLAIGWFCIGDSGDEISEATIATLARISLQVAFYLYFTAPAPV
jgi:hypothetical protein